MGNSPSVQWPMGCCVVDVVRSVDVLVKVELKSTGRRWLAFVIYARVQVTLSRCLRAAC